MSLVVLIGPPGALVPQVAGELSARRGWPYLATDDIVEQITSTNIDDYAIDHTDEEISMLEREIALASLIDVEAHDDKILALGSGCLGRDIEDDYFAGVRQELSDLRSAGARVLWLTADLTNLVKRNGLAGPRMAAVSSPRRIFYQQLTQRAPLYEQMSDERVNTSNRTVAEVADYIEELVRR